jgi:hypothetical protein
MPGPQSPDSISADKPDKAEKAKDADEAKAGQKGQKGGGGGGGKKDDTKKEDEKTWVEFQLLDADGKAVKGEKVTLTLADGSTKDDQTNGEGVVRLKDIKKGDGAKVTIQLADRYDYEWAFKEVK